jgi:thiol-disulfide isomerase/thioredoxin
MKNLLFPLIICFFSSSLFAQSTEQPPYLKNPALPDFRILQADSLTWTTKKNLKPGKPVMIMLFSPDCEHCQTQMKIIQANKKQLAELQIVMATYQPMEKMQRFYKEYKIAEFPNIYMGRDIQYFFGPFYMAKSIPFLAIYDKQHKLARVYEGGAKIDKILEAIKL